MSKWEELIILLIEPRRRGITEYSSFGSTKKGGEGLAY